MNRIFLKSFSDFFLFFHIRIFISSFLSLHMAKQLCCPQREAGTSQILGPAGQAFLIAWLRSFLSHEAALPYLETPSRSKLKRRKENGATCRISVLLALSDLTERRGRQRRKQAQRSLSSCFCAASKPFKCTSAISQSPQPVAAQTPRVSASLTPCTAL